MFMKAFATLYVFMIMQIKLVVVVEIQVWNFRIFLLNGKHPWRLHESEIQVQGDQRFFLLAASRLVFTASRLSRSSLMG